MCLPRGEANLGAEADTQVCPYMVALYSQRPLTPA